VVSFVKNRGKKKKIQIELSKDYKAMEDSLVDEIIFEDKINEQVYEQIMNN
jgi:hypothetical protein